MTTTNTSSPFITLHALQAFGPSLLNRDDNNAAKQIVFGGVPRVRVSAQAWRRPIRDEIRKDRIEGAEYVTRTTRMPQLVAAALVDLGRPADAATIKAIAMFEAMGFDPGKTPATTAVMIVATESFAGTIAKLIDGAWDEIGDKAPATGEAAGDNSESNEAATAAQSKAAATGQRNAAAAKQKNKAEKAKLVPAAVLKAADAALDIAHTIDGALFGRMLAEKADGGRVDGAASVAHAISVDAAAIEPDFWTAVDDEAPSDEPSASNMGVSMVSAPTFYRVAALDRRSMGSMLVGDAHMAAEAEACFIDGFINSNPTAKQRSSVAQTMPSVVVAVTGRRVLSAANAFVSPVTGPDMMVRSTEKLMALLSRMARAGRSASTLTILCLDPDLVDVLSTYGEVHDTVDAFIDAVAGS